MSTRRRHTHTSISLMRLILMRMNTYSNIHILISTEEKCTSTNMNIVISMLMNTRKFTTWRGRKRRMNLLRKEKPRDEHGKGILPQFKHTVFIY
ncbi:MAG: hypothetical protein ACE14P_01315 [Methanotrichaceae archaeon]